VGEITERESRYLQITDIRHDRAPFASLWLALPEPSESLNGTLSTRRTPSRLVQQYDNNAAIDNG